MDPYKAPESDLIKDNFVQMPSKIKAVYSLIGFSFVVFLIEEFFYALVDLDSIWDLSNYIFIPIWGGLLYWVTSSIKNRKENPKKTFLALSVIIAVLSFLPSSDKSYYMYTSLIEAGCFLGAFFLLNHKDSEDWFESKSK